MKFSIWHIFIPIVAILSIEIPVVTMIRFLWTGIFSLLPVALPMAIFYFFHKKKSWSDYIFIKNDKVNKLHQIIMIIFVLFLGSWIPLIDAYFITTYNTTYNTGGWLTSSVLLFLVMSTLVNFFKTEWNRRLLVFFGFALSGYLIYTALILLLAWLVIWIFGSFVWFGNLFFIITIIFINGISVFFLSYRTHKKLVPSKAEEKSIKDSKD